MEENKAIEENQTEVSVQPEEKADKSLGFKFFKNCSASLKRLSVLIFAVNVFFIIVAAVVGTVLIAYFLGGDLLSLLAIPILTFCIVLVLLSRCISALIYGFAEIVEKYEK